MAVSRHPPAAASDLDLRPVVKFLRDALEMNTPAATNNFFEIVHQLTTRDDVETLWRLYLGLTDCVTIIAQDAVAPVQKTKSVRPLVHAIFTFTWLGEDRIIRAYATLVMHMISANTTFIVPAMQMVTRSFRSTPQPGEPPGKEKVAPYTAEGIAARNEQLHATLRTLLAQVPSGVTRLGTAIVQNFPHKRLPGPMIASYVTQVLRMCDYAHGARDNALKVIIGRSIEMDVEIKITDTGEAVRDEAEQEEQLFQLDDLADGAAAPQEEEQEEVDEMAEKLDGVMLVLFKYIHRRVSEPLPDFTGPVASEYAPPWPGSRAPPPTAAVQPSNPQAGADDEEEEEEEEEGEPPELHTPSMSPAQLQEAAQLFQSLLWVFEDSVLQTHRSKYVQYLMFYLCGEVPELSELFAQRLLTLLLDQRQPKGRRQTCMAYLASFLSRAKFVSDELVSSCLASLLEWIGDYLDKRAADARPVRRRSSRDGPAPARAPVWSSEDVRGTALDFGAAGQGQREDHLVFYSMCQAAFYIMCFRGMALGPPSAEDAALWLRILQDPLQPLRHCLDTVRREFARLCCVLMAKQLPADVLTQLRAVADQDLAAHSAPATSRTGGLGRGSNPLDSFFPFDPYLLRRSHTYIHGLYNYWQGTSDSHGHAQDQADDDASESEGDSGSEDSEDENQADEGPSSDPQGRGRARLSAEDEMAVSYKLAGSCISESMSAMSMSPTPRGTSDQMLGTSQDNHWGSSLFDTFHEAVTPPPSPPPHHLHSTGLTSRRKVSVADGSW